MRQTVKIFSFLLSFFLFNSLAFAIPVLEAPEAVSQGRAFPVKLTDTAPFYGEVYVIWNDKKIPVVVRNEKDIYIAQIMLAMPTDAQSPLTLKVHAGSEILEKKIIVKGVTWPKQTLSVEPKFATPPKETEAQILRDSARNKAVLAIISPYNSIELPLIRPVKGTVSSAFGGKRVFNGSTKSVHRGTDLRGPEGTPILAVADGKVVIAEPQYYSGNVVYIDHGQGVYSSYNHLSSFYVKEGMEIKAGQEIGAVGKTGRVTGPHLHISFTLQGTSVDVMPLFESPLQLVGGPTKEPAVVPANTSKQKSKK